MDTVCYTYWEHADPPHEERHLIEDTPEAREQALREGATAFCTVSFSEPYEEGKPEPVRYGDLYLDFDSREDPIQAIDEAVSFVKNLTMTYDIDPEMLRYWLSGGKGCHIAIPDVLYGGEHGDAYLPIIHSRMVKELNTFKYDVIAPSLDMAMYQMKTGRLLRVENIRRQNGNYKVPVTWDEISSMSRNELLELVKQPRHIQENNILPERSEKLEQIFLKVQEIKTLNKNYGNDKFYIKSTEIIDTHCSFMEHCRKNAVNLSEPEWFAMLSNFAVLGRMGWELAHFYSSPYPNYSKEETSRKLDYASRQAPMTCERIKSLFDCGEKCGVTCPYQLYQTKQRNNNLGGMFHLEEDGLYFLSDPRDRSTKGQRISAPLEIIAQTRDASNGSWGRLVRFKDTEGIQHQLIIPMSEIGGNGESVRQKLAEQGLWIAHEKAAKDLLIRYLNEETPHQYARLVKRFGWVGDVYVLRDVIYGNKTGEIFIPENPRLGSTIQCQGTLDEWEEHIGRHCQENPLLALVVSFAFTGPLLTPCEFEGGGVHLFGPSSCGKTTALKVAGSVCGGGGKHGYIRQWRATDNALESTAAEHNDGFLCLDEIGQANSRVVSEVAYMLANGQGKVRASKDGSAKAIQEWRLSFLSTGELTLSDKIAEDGRGQAMAGQTVRILDIPADGGSGHGIFTKLPDGLDGNEFSRVLTDAVRLYYGSPLRAFLEQLAGARDDAVGQIEKDTEAFLSYCPKGSSGQVKRACQRFGLIAAAGELAIAYDVLPWPEGTARQAALFGFQAWLRERGGIGDREIEYALERVKKFFQQYADSRFALIDSYHTDSPSNRAGYRWEQNGKWLYLIESSVFQNELCRGVSRTALLARMKELGWMALNGAGKIMETKSVPRRGNIRGVILVPRVWEDTGKQDESFAPPLTQAVDMGIF